MHKLYYCQDCKRVFKNEEKCLYCESGNIKEMKKNSPVNVLGTKQKGRVLKIVEDTVKLLIITEAKEQLIKEYKAENLKKVL